LALGLLGATVSIPHRLRIVKAVGHRENDNRDAVSKKGADNARKLQFLPVFSDSKGNHDKKQGAVLLKLPPVFILAFLMLRWLL